MMKYYMINLYRKGEYEGYDTAFTDKAQAEAKASWVKDIYKGKRSVKWKLETVEVEKPTDLDSGNFKIIESVPLN